MSIKTCFLLLQISLPSPTLDDAALEVEVFEPLRSAIKYQLEAGNVRLIEDSDEIALEGSAGEKIWGVPRLVESTKGTVVTLQLIQPWLPAARLDLTVADFNHLAFHLGFVEVEWELSCDAAERDDHACLIADLTHRFLRVYGEVPLSPFERPIPKAWPGDDEWATDYRQWPIIQSPEPLGDWAFLHGLRPTPHPTQPGQ